jgi:hypothetical protein
LQEDLREILEFDSLIESGLFRRTLYDLGVKDNPAGAKFHQAEVAGNPEKPGAKRPRASERIERIEGTKEGILRKIGAAVPIPHEC